jgi:tetratricopeptide (TPR) repeat protein
LTRQPGIRAGRWLAAAAAALFAVAMLPDAVGAARRNRAYLHLLHTGTVPEVGATDDLLTLRRSVQQGDWATTRAMLARTSRPDRLAPLIVLHEADRRVRAGDLAGARAALEALRSRGEYDSVVWYQLGTVYERANLPEDAVQAYARGAAIDPAAPWTEGRYRIAMIYQRQKKWQPLADALAPLVLTASDADLGRKIESVTGGGAVWQGTVLALGEAYENLNRPADAEAAYERMARLTAPRRDWTLNRALVYLARAKRGHGDFGSAIDALGRALDLATEFDASFRREYELDTAGEAGRLVDHARRAGQLATVRTAAAELVQRVPESPGAWYLRGLVNEASCDAGQARSDYDRARTLVRPGSGAFLAGRPIDPSGSPCAPR